MVSVQLQTIKHPRVTGKYTALRQHEVVRAACFSKSMAGSLVASHRLVGHDQCKCLPTSKALN